MFNQIHFEFVKLREMILENPTVYDDSNMSPSDQIEWLKKLVEQKQNTLEQKYLSRLDTLRPFDLMISLFTKMMLAKTRLLIYYTCMVFEDHHMSFSTKDEVFALSVEVLQTAYTLKTDPRSQPWSWLLKGYIEWQALSCVIKAMNQCSDPLQIDRARVVLDRASQDQSFQHPFWQPLLRLVCQVHKNCEAILRRRHSGMEISPPLSVARSSPIFTELSTGTLESYDSDSRFSLSSFPDLPSLEVPSDAPLCEYAIQSNSSAHKNFEDLRQIGQAFGPNAHAESETNLELFPVLDGNDLTTAFATQPENRITDFWEELGMSTSSMSWNIAINPRDPVSWTR